MVLMVGFSMISWAQAPILNFRITSPRIIRTINWTYGSSCDNLTFNIELCSSAISYYHGIEIHMTNNNAALTNLYWIKGPLCTTPSNYMYTQTYNMANDNINLSIANTAYLPGDGNPSNWVQLTTSWQVLGTIVLRITDITAVENCTWLPALMDVSLHVQVEKTFSPNTIRDYSGITTAGTPIANLYLGRIYSSTWGW